MRGVQAAARRIAKRVYSCNVATRAMASSVPVATARANENAVVVMRVKKVELVRRRTPLRRGVVTCVP